MKQNNLTNYGRIANANINRLNLKMMRLFANICQIEMNNVFDAMNLNIFSNKIKDVFWKNDQKAYSNFIDDTINSISNALKLGDGMPIIIERNSSSMDIFQKKIKTKQDIKRYIEALNSKNVKLQQHLAKQFEPIIEHLISTNKMKNIDIIYNMIIDEQMKIIKNYLNDVTVTDFFIDYFRCMMNIDLKLNHIYYVYKEEKQNDKIYLKNLINLQKKEIKYTSALQKYSIYYYDKTIHDNIIDLINYIDNITKEPINIRYDCKVLLWQYYYLYSKYFKDFAISGIVQALQNINLDKLNMQNEVDIIEKNKFNYILGEAKYLIDLSNLRMMGSIDKINMLKWFPIS